MWISPFTPKTVTVYESDRKQYDTGLLLPSGQKIVRVEQRRPIGFVWFPERENGEEE